MSAPRGRRELVLGCGVFLFGIAVAIALHAPSLGEYGRFKDDVVQSPHWASYHGATFRPDDLVVRYASYNESPLQNAIYWVATWWLDSVTLSEVLGVASYGLLALVAFLVVRAMYGTRAGLMAVAFVTLFPDQWDYSAGFFSKFWAIPTLLVGVWFLEAGKDRGLLLLLPFAALAYPTAGVVLGMLAGTYALLALPRDRARAKRLLPILVVAGLLAGSVLSWKYVTPPESIGAMRSGDELRRMPEIRDGGFPSRYVPLPTVGEALLEPLSAFVVVQAALFLLVLRRGVAWQRSWSALLLASAAGYVLADLLFMRLYIPNRYTRYSLAVLLVLWHARNWDLVLERVARPLVRGALVAGLLLGGLVWHWESYHDGVNWTDRTAMTPPSRYIRDELPAGVLFAGAPRALDDVMVQGKRSVLVPYKLSHPWFVEYYDEVRERTRATLAAHFAADAGPVDELHRRYAVTHFLVDRELFERARDGRRLYASPYNEEAYRALGPRRSFFLEHPPRDRVLWEDERYVILALPLVARAAP